MDDYQSLRSTSMVKASYWFPDGESTTSGLTPISSASLIDSTLFTHLFCSLADLDSETHKVIISYNHEQMFSTFTATVKIKNPHLQTLLSIGGRNADKSAFASMASNDTSRKAFIDSSIEISRRNGFHGLDLAWEYPSNEVEMTNFAELLQEWRVAITDESKRTGRIPLLLTAAVYYSSEYKSVSYRVKDFIDSLDWVNLIAYDFYGPGWSQVTGPPAALSVDKFKPKGPSGKSGLNKWLKAGLPEKKAVFGFSYVAWAWTLKDEKDNGYWAATTGAAISSDGSVNYAEVRNYIMNNGAAVVHDTTVNGDYCYAGVTWIGYDDNESIVKKVNYAKYKGLLGYFSWHVGADYNCGLSRAGNSSF